MNKTVNINLGGSLFQVDEEAFIILRDYIQAINSRLRNVAGGTETIEDIESRIAEIFRSQKGIAGIITRENVDQMISTLGKPEDFDAGISSQETESAKHFTRRLYRNPDETIIGGVCGGLGTYLNTDPVLFRILFVLFALFGGAGILIYLVFWIAVPVAYSEDQKRELYGSSYYSSQNKVTYRHGNGLNEVISAFGKVLYIILRIFVAAFGAALVITGFLLAIAFVMIFILKIPGAFTIDSPDFNLMYVPEMLRYIFSTGAATWIWILTTMVVVMPMLALVYWGLKMIFWFRVKDGIFNLSALIIWVVAMAALSILIFDQGVSFSERSSVSSRNVLDHNPDTLFLVSGNRIEDIDYERQFSTPGNDNRYNVFFTDSNIFIKPRLYFNISGEKSATIDIVKGSSGRDRHNASKNAGKIEYNYLISGDSVHLDQYFTIPSDKKWSADIVNVEINMPENTVIFLDDFTADLLVNRFRIKNGDEENWVHIYQDRRDMGGRYWKLTEQGAEEVIQTR